MFLISQEGLAQQLFNDGAALQSETKRYACFFFSFVIMTGRKMKYSSYLHGPLFSRAARYLFALQWDMHLQLQYLAANPVEIILNLWCLNLF